VAGGVRHRFLVPCGTTGETPTLTHDEWLHVIDTTIEVAAGRVPIMAGATSNSTRDAVEKAKEIAARPGVDAILTASPYYNNPRKRGSTALQGDRRGRGRQACRPLQRARPHRSEPGAGDTSAAGGDSKHCGVKEACGNMTQIAEAINAVPETSWFSPEMTPSHCR